MNKGIIVVSFGTSFEDVDRRCLQPIEKAIAGAHPDKKVVRAFTSGMVIRKLKNRDNNHVDNIEEAIQGLLDQGIRDIHVQPLHVIPGIEYEKVKKAVAVANHQSDLNIRLGEPLLYREEHYDELVETLLERLPEEIQGQKILLMGHGTRHYANAVYSMLQLKFTEKRKDIIIANVEGFPKFEQVKNQLTGSRHILMLPLMIVAGDHAMNDMAGDEEDSFKSLVQSMGMTTECILEGLGENPRIHELFVRRTLNK